MKTRLPTHELLDLIEQRRYGVEYQPVVSTRDGTILGYEALARFYTETGVALAPQHVFDSLHASPLSLYLVEFEMKRLQLLHAPRGGVRLFINLDPDAFEAGVNGALHPMVAMLSNHRGVVVEIIENSTINDADLSESMAAAFSACGVELALDDIGADRSMLSLEILLGVDFLKLDRSWVLHRDDPVRCAFLRHLVAFARESGKQTILEGIETEVQLEFAKFIGVDFVQGFLYSPLFYRTGCLTGNLSTPSLGPLRRESPVPDSSDCLDPVPA